MLYGLTSSKQKLKYFLDMRKTRLETRERWSLDASTPIGPSVVFEISYMRMEHFFKRTSKFRPRLGKSGKEMELATNEISTMFLNFEKIWASVLTRKKKHPCPIKMKLEASLGCIFLWSQGKRGYQGVQLGGTIKTPCSVFPDLISKTCF